MLICQLYQEVRHLIITRYLLLTIFSFIALSSQIEILWKVYDHRRKGDSNYSHKRVEMLVVTIDEVVSKGVKG